MADANPFWSDLCTGVFGEIAPQYSSKGQGHLPSYFKVSDLAEASIGLAGTALARLTAGQDQTVEVDRRLASLWFDMTVRPIGWEAPSIWDAVAGNYACADGWIRLHTNAPHHLKAALSVLGAQADRASVAGVVRDWKGYELETAIVQAGGCAAQMRGLAEWQDHAQGKAVAAEPLVHWEEHGACDRVASNEGAHLQGLKVLDLTRVLAGPVATRFLAGFGAQVLRIDPPFWNEPSAEIEVTLGKRCAGLDLRKADDLNRIKELMKQADVLVHGYRADALEGLGLGADVRRALNPAMVDVCLNAYGWSGPWSTRRGFDSLVQMSCGIAAHGMAQKGADMPVPLPVQALDHATGYLIAACALEALAKRREGRVLSAKLSLARTAVLLMKHQCSCEENGSIQETLADRQDEIEQTGWGPAKRLKPPLHVSGHVPDWPIPAGPLRRDPATW